MLGNGLGQCLFDYPLIIRIVLFFTDPISVRLNESTPGHLGNPVFTTFSGRIRVTMMRTDIIIGYCNGTETRNVMSVMCTLP